AVGLLRFIPVAVLGVFLVYVGVQHAALIRDILKRSAPLIVATSVGLVSLVTTNLTWGFLAGFLLEGAVTLFRRTRAKAARAAESSEAGG
ncbi:MAG: hypothetical protein DMG23_09330, partial [Acidobacteria bacterium]